MHEGDVKQLTHTTVKLCNSMHFYFMQEVVKMLTANFISQHLLYVHPLALQQRKYNRAENLYKAINKCEQCQKPKQLKHEVFKSSAH